MKLGELAKLTNTTTKTIRFYEDPGCCSARTQRAGIAITMYGLRT
jgi:DNA-binding transcriptional MerR regulator